MRPFAVVDKPQQDAEIVALCDLYLKDWEQIL